MTNRSQLLELTLVRLREFIREPEAVFWTFVFPLLLAAGLGIAFRNRPPETARIGILESPALEQAAAAIDTAAGLTAVPLADDSAAALALRTGKVALVIAPNDNGGVEYRFDPSRPDARAARLLADRTVQSAAGRVDPVQVSEAIVRERGSRYIDFFIPGLLGLSLMSSGVWSIAFSMVTARSKKLLKRLVATPMSRVQYLMSFLFSRLFFLVLEVTILLGFGALVFDVPIRGSFVALGVICLLAALMFSAMGLLVSSRARTVGGSLRPRQPGDAADVDFLWSVLLLGKLPRGATTVHPGAAPHGRSGFPPRRDPAGNPAYSPGR